jgi:CheY-like chemotaxis protein
MSIGRVILVIEDDHEVRAFLGDALRDEGYQVLLAESGEAALEHLTTVQPDLITTDLNLPGIGGGQLIQALRQQPAAEKVPIIVVSGEANIEISVREPIQAVVPKPFNLEKLLSTIRTFLPPQ